MKIIGAKQGNSRFLSDPDPTLQVIPDPTYKVIDSGSDSGSGSKANFMTKSNKNIFTNHFEVGLYCSTVSPIRKFILIMY